MKWQFSMMLECIRSGVRLPGCVSGPSLAPTKLYDLGLYDLTSVHEVFSSMKGSSNISQGCFED